jgi:hypothetical protein
MISTNQAKIESFKEGIKIYVEFHKPAALAIWQQATVPTRVVFEYITVN